MAKDPEPINLSNVAAGDSVIVRLTDKQATRLAAGNNVLVNLTDIIEISQNANPQIKYRAEFNDGNVQVFDNEQDAIDAKNNNGAAAVTKFVYNDLLNTKIKVDVIN